MTPRVHLRNAVLAVSTVLLVAAGVAAAGPLSGLLPNAPPVGPGAAPDVMPWAEEEPAEEPPAHESWPHEAHDDEAPAKEASDEQHCHEAADPQAHGDGEHGAHMPPGSHDSERSGHAEHDHDRAAHEKPDSGGNGP